MRWEGIAALAATLGLIASLIAAFMSKLRQEGKADLQLETFDRRATEIERDLDELEKRVTHCAKNIAILDERTTHIGGGGRER
jgi:hypothetical protein